jgi:hypothetical protein
MTQYYYCHLGVKATRLIACGCRRRRERIETRQQTFRCFHLIDTKFRERERERDDSIGYDLKVDGHSKHVGVQKICI